MYIGTYVWSIYEYMYGQVDFGFGRLCLYIVFVDINIVRVGSPYVCQYTKWYRLVVYIAIVFRTAV